jgi:hypothetical protein
MVARTFLSHAPHCRLGYRRMRSIYLPSASCFRGGLAGRPSRGRGQSVSLDAIHSSPVSSLPSRWSCGHARASFWRAALLARCPSGALPFWRAARRARLAPLSCALLAPWSFRPTSGGVLLVAMRARPSGAQPFWLAWLSSSSPYARPVSRMRRPSASSAALLIGLRSAVQQPA